MIGLGSSVRDICSMTIIRIDDDIGGVISIGVSAGISIIVFGTGASAGIGVRVRISIGTGITGAYVSGGVRISILFNWSI